MFFDDTNPAGAGVADDTATEETATPADAGVADDTETTEAPQA